MVIIMKRGWRKVKASRYGSIFHFVANVVQCQRRIDKIGSTREEEEWFYQPAKNGPLTRSQSEPKEENYRDRTRLWMVGETSRNYLREETYDRND